MATHMPKAYTSLYPTGKANIPTNDLSEMSKLNDYLCSWYMISIPGMSLYRFSIWLVAALLVSVCVLTKSYLVAVYYFVIGQVV